MYRASEVATTEQQFNGYELYGRQLRVNAGLPPPKREDSFSRGPRSIFGSSGSTLFKRPKMSSEPWMVLIWTGGRLEFLKLRLGLQGASFEHQSMASYSLERYD